MSRPFDIVVWGATGFTGRLAALYMAERLKTHKPAFKFAIAGRNAEKLERVAQQILDKTQQKVVRKPRAPTNICLR